MTPPPGIRESWLSLIPTVSKLPSTRYGPVHPFTGKPGLILLKAPLWIKFYIGTDNTPWTEVGRTERESLWPLYFPDYKLYGKSAAVKPDSELKISLAEEVNPRYINFSTVELIKADDGQRIKSDFNVVNKKDVVVKPAARLSPGEYWLVLHDNIRLNSGQSIGQGMVARFNIVE
jgi:hypothetical protein